MTEIISPTLQKQMQDEVDFLLYEYPHLDVDQVWAEVKHQHGVGPKAKTVDPTAFDIDFDPTVQRMRGYAAHGNTPFDVPFVSQITDNLWQGGCETGLVLPYNIKHLISLYPWERYEINHELDTELYVRMYDSTSQGFDQVKVIAQLVNACRKSGPTLVHCQAGLNRSSLVATTALILSGMDNQEAVDLIREQRSPACLCNPSFERWLLEEL